MTKGGPRSLFRRAYGRALLEALEGQGWSLGIRSGGHLEATSPDGSKVIMAATPSDHRVRLNVISDLRRNGLIVERD